MTGDIYCPRLQTLQLTKRAALDDKDALSFLQSRMGASKYPTGNVKPLREFHAVLSLPIELDIQVQLSEYIDNGPLMLSVSYDHDPRPERRSPPKIRPYDGVIRDSRRNYSGMLYSECDLTLNNLLSHVGRMTNTQKATRSIEHVFLKTG